MKRILLLGLIAISFVSCDKVATKVLKKVAKKTMSEMAEATTEQVSKKATKNTVLEIAEESAEKNAADAISKLGENTLKTTNEEFSQQIGKTISEDVSKQLGTETSQEALEHSAQQVMEKEAIITSKTWIEKQKDLLRKVRLQLLKKVRKSNAYQDLLDIHKKGAIILTDKEVTELLANPQYFREYLKVKCGSKDVVEFFIRLKKSNPEQLRQLLGNQDIKAYVKKSLRGKGGNHEWLICENLEDFLLNPKWGNDGDLLAVLLPRFSQATDKVRFARGGGHISSAGIDATNSVLFHNKLNEIIHTSNSTEELLINMRRFAKQNLTPESYIEFEKTLEYMLE